VSRWCVERPPYCTTFLVISGCDTVRSSENQSATHLFIGRSSANERARFKKMPTETGSTTTDPKVCTWRSTLSKIGRSKAGPVEKYSSRVSAGAHKCDWAVLAKRRPHFGQSHDGTGPFCRCGLWRC